MVFIADLHIHSKYSRACSKNLTIPELDRWADDKGILVMGTGDFTHPEWLKHLKETLGPAETGLFKVKDQHKLLTRKGTKAETRFLLTVEISSIYSRAGKLRRIHNLIFAPDFQFVEKFNAALEKRGAKLGSDGRPIVGIDSAEIAKMVFDASSDAAVVPAHIWTPWFSVFGSKSGFNSLEECFGDYAKYIFAAETGLSSDPLMNWRWSALDKIALISNSDSHSLERIGREANIFDTDLSYEGIMSALRKNDPRGDLRSGSASRSAFVATIEYFPEEGKYHLDGHRKCEFSCEAKETRKLHGLCPKCKKPLIVGVLNRVDKLADREEIKPEKIKFGEVMANKWQARVPYINLVTLDSIIGEALDLGVKSKAVKKEYDALIKAFKSELNLLIDTPLSEISKLARPEIAEGIKRMRSGQLTIAPGYDGEYGIVKIFSDKEKSAITNGQTLF